MLKLQTPNFKFQAFWNLAIDRWDLKSGFTLIELLIVITLFGIAASLVTVSYLTFERNQRVKDAAKNLKNDIRFAQNKALSGDKGIGTGGDVCLNELAGWYVTIAKGASNYSISGNCLNSNNETTFASNTRQLPAGVTVLDILYGSSSISNEVNIFFRPLANTVSFHDEMLFGLDFLDDTTGALTNELPGSSPEKVLAIQLEGENATGQYEVDITSSGEISEKKL